MVVVLGAFFFVGWSLWNLYYSKFDKKRISNNDQKKKKKHRNTYCKDLFWLGPKIGLGFSPISPNNKFVVCEKKN